MDTEIPGLPDSLRPISPSPFVGRAAELERLRTLMPWAEGEGRRVALLAGEPGAGKSRLAREFAAGAASEGALVLYGACDAVVRTPYGPFVEALDRLVRVTEAEELRAALGSGAAELTRLLPDLPAVAGELPEPVEADPDTERHRLHTAVADLLANVSRERPMLLVLEDAHWADAPTLLLLRFLARAAWRARLLILVTFRDTEADKVPGGLAETLADLRRADDVLRMRLPGLSEAEVSDLVSRAAGDLGRDPELPELASTIHDLTGGNAFLVCELWRALLETGTVEVVDGCIVVTRPLAELAHPRKRQRGGQPAALAPGPEHLRPARARRRRRAGVRARADRPGRQADRARAPGRPRGSDRQRNDRGAPLAADGLPLHPRDRAAGPLRPALAAAPGGAPPQRRRGPRGHHRRGLRPRARGPRPPFRLSGPVRRGRAGDRVQPPRRAGGERLARLRRCRDQAADGARDRDRGRARARGRPPRARLGRPPRRQGDRCGRGVRGGGGDRPWAGERRAAGAGGDRLRGILLAPGVGEPGRGRAARRGADGGGGWER